MKLLRKQEAGTTEKGENEATSEPTESRSTEKTEEAVSEPRTESNTEKSTEPTSPTSAEPLTEEEPSTTQQTTATTLKAAQPSTTEHHTSLAQTRNLETNKSAILVQSFIPPSATVNYPHPFRQSSGLMSSTPHAIGTQFRPIDITQTKAGQETLRRNPPISEEVTSKSSSKLDPPIGFTESYYP